MFFWVWSFILFPLLESFHYSWSLKVLYWEGEQTWETIDVTAICNATLYSLLHSLFKVSCLPILFFARISMILSFPGIYSRALWVSLSPIYRYCCSHNKIMPINHNYPHLFLAQFHLQLSTLPTPQNRRWDFRIFDGGQQVEEIIPSSCMKFTPFSFKALQYAPSIFSGELFQICLVFRASFFLLELPSFSGNSLP